MSGEVTGNNGTIPSENGEGLDKPIGRRVLMLGAAAGVGAAAASLAGSEPAGAQDGDPVLQGQTNTAPGGTTVIAPVASGLPRVLGALVGDSNSQDGVLGLSSAGNGVQGVTTGTRQSGVYGVTESSGDNANSVYGFDNSSGGGHGVLGESAHGTGVYGFQDPASGLANGL